ncbi:hypothetical protein FB45DRAFT_863036 [Roridomyces roridus]|uniref:Uncharacterized protein n=1 Tax=Roridomyces roridus TaxID=1738132 RepID=A0AAD7C8K3_9AGAR|nr:hypothetical protein FB45DRAFT_863036 [Roridomyces roridus]
MVSYGVPKRARHESFSPDAWSSSKGGPRHYACSRPRMGRRGAHTYTGQSEDAMLSARPTPRPHGIARTSRGRRDSVHRRTERGYSAYYIGEGWPTTSKMKDGAAMSKAWARHGVEWSRRIRVQWFVRPAQRLALAKSRILRSIITRFQCTDSEDLLRLEFAWPSASSFRSDVATGGDVAITTSHGNGLVRTEIFRGGSLRDTVEIGRVMVFKSKHMLSLDDARRAGNAHPWVQPLGRILYAQHPRLHDDLPSSAHQARLERSESGIGGDSLGCTQTASSTRPESPFSRSSPRHVDRARSFTDPHATDLNHLLIPREHTILARDSEAVLGYDAERGFCTAPAHAACQTSHKCQKADWKGHKAISGQPLKFEDVQEPRA